MADHTFDIGKWHANLLFTATAFESLTNLVEDEQSLRHHLDRRVVVTSDDTGTREMPLGDSRFAEELRKGVLANIALAHELYSSQMTVLAASHLESMLDEFFHAVFVTHPQRMNEFLFPEAEKKTVWNVSLNEVIASGSIPELLSKTAGRAVVNATSGEMSKILKRLERVTKYDLPKDLVRQVVELDKLRNQIVHDMNTRVSNRAAVIAQFDLLTDLLQELGKAAQQSGIPIYDPSGLVIRDADEGWALEIQDALT